MIQTRESTLLDEIFTKYLGMLHDKSIQCRCFFLCIVNVIKHLLLERVLSTIIKEYREEVLTFTKRIPGSKSTPTLHDSINDDDVNIFFGWAVMKLKIKLKEQRTSSIQTETISTKIKILDDMSTTVINLVNDKVYL